MSGDAASTRARIVGEVCERIAGGESVAKIFASPGADFPNINTFWRWIHADADLERIYERATEQRGELYAEEIIEIVDQKPPQVAGAYGTHIDAAWVQWQRNRADSRKWVAARMRPKRYGDRTILAGDADNPIQFAADAAIARKLLPELAAGDAPGKTLEPDDD